ncbi:riboflavin synthase [Candidatus Gottesmanbacteria bacterium]|nr:riboflavin synthase [Candidatus Gottesmanbacteria bacterium]
MKEGLLYIILTPKARGFFIPMFTGIINHLGKVKNKTQNKLYIECSKNLISKLSEGASIAIDGICLTVVKMNKDSFEIDLMPETKQRTNIKYLKTGALVDLELPTTPTTFLGGHIVYGHIDGVAKLKNITDINNSYTLTFSVPASLSKYIAEKGSISVNGISLTVIKENKNYFTVGIIPHTWEQTMLHTIKIGNFVNIEVDVLAKYLDKLLKR